MQEDKNTMSHVVSESDAEPEELFPYLPIEEEIALCVDDADLFPSLPINDSPVVGAPAVEETGLGSSGPATGSPKLQKERSTAEREAAPRKNRRCKRTSSPGALPNSPAGAATNGVEQGASRCICVVNDHNAAASLFPSAEKGSKDVEESSAYPMLPLDDEDDEAEVNARSHHQEPANGDEGEASRKSNRNYVHVEHNLLDEDSDEDTPYPDFFSVLSAPPAFSFPSLPLPGSDGEREWLPLQIEENRSGKDGDHVEVNEEDGTAQEGAKQETASASCLASASMPPEDAATAGSGGGGLAPASKTAESEKLHLRKLRKRIVTQSYHAELRSAFEAHEAASRAKTQPAAQSFSSLAASSRAAAPSKAADAESEAKSVIEAPMVLRVADAERQADKPERERKPSKKRGEDRRAALRAVITELEAEEQKLCTAHTRLNDCLRRPEKLYEVCKRAWRQEATARKSSKKRKKPAKEKDLEAEKDDKGKFAGVANLRRALNSILEDVFFGLDVSDFLLTEDDEHHFKLVHGEQGGPWSALNFEQLAYPSAGPITSESVVGRSAQQGPDTPVVATLWPGWALHCKSLYEFTCCVQTFLQFFYMQLRQDSKELRDTVSRCRLPAHQRVAAGRTKRINDGDEEVGAENHRREYQVQGRAPPRTSGEVETARAKKAARDKVAREMMEKFRATLKDEGKKGPSS